VIEVGFLRGRAHRYRVLAFVAEDDLLLASATSFLCRKGHGTMPSTIRTTIAATTPKIDTLRLIRILLPCVGGLVL
jgi:hypothetical protein